MRNHVLPAALALGLTSMLGAQVGEPLPAVKLTDFAGTQAQSLDDYAGRLLLLEFFAFW